MQYLIQILHFHFMRTNFANNTKLENFMKYLFFLYQWFVAAPILIVFSIISSLIVFIGAFLGLGKYTNYYPFKFAAKLYCILLFTRVKVNGAENIDKETSYIFIANHQGAYDIFSIYGYLNHKFFWMMKKSLEKIPLVGYACKKIGHIMVDRTNSITIKHTMEEAKRRLKGGNSLMIFPEGARTWDGKMRKFKRGAFILSKDFKLPIVPITIDGAFRVMPRTTFNVTPGRIILTIHKPIPAPQNNEEIEQAMLKSFAEIESSLPANYKN